MANESTYKLYADEDMLTEFGSPTPNGKQQNIHHNGRVWRGYGGVIADLK